MATLLTIAGFDPSSGAGVTADLAVFQAHGWFGTACVTALTVQSTLGVAAVHPVDARVIADTLACLEADLPPDGVKIGMLGTAGCVDAVATYLERMREAGRRPVVVLDPVLRSSSGRALLDGEGVELLQERLLPLVDWVTPNVEEMGILSGRACPEGGEAMEAAARALAARYSRLGVVATGGHREPPDDLVLEAGGEPHWLRGERVRTTSTHGTGCAFSSALLCLLAGGERPVAAAARAKRYLVEALRRATPIGHGRGPMNLLWPLTGASRLA